MIKSFLFVVLAIVLAATTMAFSPSAFKGSQLSTRVTSKSQLNMIFGGPKDDGKPGDYVCLDCGYVFTKGPEAWAKLPDNWSCPPCGAVKRRFKKVPKGSASGKVEVKKSWF